MPDTTPQAPQQPDLTGRTLGDFQILRKNDPYKQKVLQQLVYDDRYAPKKLLEKGWPERWSAMSRSVAAPWRYRQAQSEARRSSYPTRPHENALFGRLGGTVSALFRPAD